jgi:hypothetical protein
MSTRRTGTCPAGGPKTDTGRRTRIGTLTVAWRRHSGLAMVGRCTGFRSAARTSVPARLSGARSSMRTFRKATTGSTSQIQPARNPCRTHNDCVQPLRPPEGTPGKAFLPAGVGPPASFLGHVGRYAAPSFRSRIHNFVSYLTTNPVSGQHHSGRTQGPSVSP